MFSFDPLWKKLIDKKIGRVEFARLIGASTATVTKMGKNGYVSMDVLDRVCAELNCRIEDVICYVPDDRNDEV